MDQDLRAHQESIGGALWEIEINTVSEIVMEKRSRKTPIRTPFGKVLIESDVLPEAELLTLSASTLGVVKDVKKRQSAKPADGDSEDELSLDINEGHVDSDEELWKLPTLRSGS
jgi:hypothetical protein